MCRFQQIPGSYFNAQTAYLGFYCVFYVKRSWEFFLSFHARLYHSPGAGAARLRGKGPMESRLVRSVGSRGPAGGVMGSVIVPAVWIAGRGNWGAGWKDGVRNPGKKKKGGEGTPQLPVLSLTPLCLCLSMDRPAVWEAGRISTARCTSPSFVPDSISSFFLRKLSCNYFLSIWNFKVDFN